MRIITDPVRVTLIARTRIEWEALADLMAERGLEWKHAPRPAVGGYEPSPRVSVAGTEGSLLAEYAGRGCYNSFGGPNGSGMGRGSNAEYLAHIIESGHGSVLEHVTFTFQIHGCSRGLTHELVRHRVGTAFSQASTRFRDESAGAFVVPPLVRAWFAAEDGGGMTEYTSGFLRAVEYAATSYDGVLGLLKDSKLLTGFGLRGTAARKAARGIARSLLPIGLESPIVLTVNARAARNVLDQRATPWAEAEIREMAVAMWRILVQQEPALFGDYTLHRADDGTEYLTTPHRKV
jgi:thymidylate synthase (FAD)